LVRGLGCGFRDLLADLVEEAAAEEHKILHVVLEVVLLAPEAVD